MRQGGAPARAPPPPEPEQMASTSHADSPGRSSSSSIVMLLTFAVFYLMPAGDPALRFAGKSPTEESLALIRERLGLDQPWYEQFGRFVGTSSRATRTAGPGSDTPTSRNHRCSAS